MKSRDLLTTPVLIVTNYVIEPYSGGGFLHRFTPETTSTVYKFIANQEPELVVGERYNIGYRVEDGENVVDMSATAKANDVNKDVSFYVASLIGAQLRETELNKSLQRVSYRASDGIYLGKKYAWRIYGMMIARDTFDEYLTCIGHPSVPCITDESPSVAYREDGLKEAMEKLIISSVLVGGNRFKSNLLPSKKWFQIKGITAITDKK
ncbi:hypothetical protein [Lysobacter antibioticus]|uniref:hypothetical protein n=1 Tax=Lysobacter antibioticus TaxID=84531 RepID=UPI001269974F|nr:hypothetical protein [Lysobacter antibioticus]